MLRIIVIALCGLMIGSVATAKPQFDATPRLEPHFQPLPAKAEGFTSRCTSRKLCVKVNHTVTRASYTARVIGPSTTLKRTSIISSRYASRCGGPEPSLAERKRALDKPEGWSQAKWDRHFAKASQLIDIREDQPTREIRQETQAAVEQLKQKQEELVGSRYRNSGFRTSVNHYTGYLSHYHQSNPLDPYLRIPDFRASQGASQVKQFLAQHTALFGFTEASAETLVLTKTEVAHLEMPLDRGSEPVALYTYIFEQQYDSIPMYSSIDATLRVEVSAKGLIREVQGDWHTTIPSQSSDPTLGPEEAHRIWNQYWLRPPRELGPKGYQPIDPDSWYAGFNYHAESERQPGTVGTYYWLLYWLPVGDGYRLAWIPADSLEDKTQSFWTAIDAHSGEMLVFKPPWYRGLCPVFVSGGKAISSPRGWVFAPHPDAGEPVVRSLAGNLEASPQGWPYSAPKPGGGRKYFSLGGNNACVADRRLTVDEESTEGDWFIGAEFPGYSPFSDVGDFKFNFGNQYVLTNGDALDDDVNLTVICPSG